MIASCALLDRFWLSLAAIGSSVAFGGFKRDTAVKFLRLWPILEDFDEAREPGVGLGAVDDAVVDGQRHVSHQPNQNGVLRADIAHHDALPELADAEDRRLPLVK